MGHYSNPATEPTDEDRSGPLDRAPLPAAPPRAQRRLRAADVDALLERYRAGETIMQLAGRFGISRTTVMAHLDRRGVERRAIAKLWDDAALTVAARSYDRGYSLAHVAAEFGLDPSTVANRLRRAGVSIRPDEAGGDPARRTPERNSGRILHGAGRPVGSWSRASPQAGTSMTPAPVFRRAFWGDS